MIATDPQKSGGSVGDYLRLYDRYKDHWADYANVKEETWVRLQYPELKPIVSPTMNTTPSSTKTNPSLDEARLPRIFLGIFTMDSPIERERRDRIRKTYLRAYKGTPTPNRICSIPQLVQRWHNETKLPPGTSRDPMTCQLVYTFVVGGNTDPNGPTEWIPSHHEADDDDENEETVVARSPRHLSDHDQGDIVYLNIRENGKEGKSQTFFHFAVTAAARRHADHGTLPYFDYLAKTDSDTLLFPEILLDRLLPRLPVFPYNMRTYVGHYRIKPSAPTMNLGPAYMGGESASDSNEFLETNDRHSQCHMYDCFPFLQAIFTCCLRT